MKVNGPQREGWVPFMIVALAGLIVIYAVSTLSLGQMPEAAVMAITAILVVAAYEYFIGWG